MYIVEFLLLCLATFVCAIGGGYGFRSPRPIPISAFISFGLACWFCVQAMEVSLKL